MAAHLLSDYQQSPPPPSLLVLFLDNFILIISLDFEWHPPPFAPFIFFIYLLKAKINANGEEYSC